MSRTTILFVDDDPHIQKLICSFLKRRGYEVLSALDGELAIAILTNRRPDLLITDYNMPKLNGCALTRWVRANPTTAKLPVIMLTATPPYPDHPPRECPDGANIYITKPVEMALLAAQIEEILVQSYGDH
ncbi:MAG: hypothetical protein NVS2B7_19840 [Herpetosiphon sp.]